MHITMTDMMPVGLCLATNELFDAVRYQRNFCDHTLLRARGSGMESTLTPLKKELNSSDYQKKYLEGHKAAIVSNIDKILSIASARYAKMNFRSIEALTIHGRSLMNKVIAAESFQELSFLQPTFKSKITLVVYEMFIEYNKRSENSGRFQ